MMIVFSKYRACISGVSEASNGYTGALMLESKCSGTSTILWQIVLMFVNESRKPYVS